MIRLFIILTIVLGLSSCNNSDSNKSESKQTDTSVTTVHTSTESKDTDFHAKAMQTNLAVLVLPPHDIIANAGVSPDMQKYLEKVISKDTSLNLIKFPMKQLMHVPYQNVFDKKYCKPITDKIKTDIIVMSKIDQATQTGKMSTDKWNFQIKIYNTNSDKQINSTVQAENLTNENIKKILAYRREHLSREIKRTANIGFY